MNTAYISLGSNLGDRAENIKKAIEILKAEEKIKVKKESSIYETEPIGGPLQGFFLNKVIEIETSFTPLHLINFLKETEKKLGREKREKWGPRFIDLDILFFNDLILKDVDLEIPHPRLTERKFVLVPLAEISPELCYPGSGKKIKKILEERKDNQTVTLYVHREN